VKNNFNYSYINLSKDHGGCLLAFAKEKHLIPGDFNIDLLCDNGSYDLFFNLNYRNIDLTYDHFVKAFEHCYGKYLKMDKKNTFTIKIRNNNDGTVSVIEENVMKFEDFLEYLKYRDAVPTIQWV